MHKKQDFTYIGYRFKLYPTPSQEEIFKRYFGACRVIYNLGIDMQEAHYKQALIDGSKKTLSYFTLERKFTEIKKTDEYAWLNELDNYIKYVLHDVVMAYKKYFKGICNHPKYKKKLNYHQMFPVRGDRITMDTFNVYIPSIGNVVYNNYDHTECIGRGNKDAKRAILPYKHYINPRVIYDGYSYWITFNMPEHEEEHIIPNSCIRFIYNDIWNEKDCSGAVGIDIGNKKNNYIVDSNGNRISKPKNFYKAEERVKFYKSKLATKRKVNKGKRLNSTVAQDELEEPNYTKNEEKILKKINKHSKRCTNIIKDCANKYACKLINIKPKAVVVEGFRVKNMYQTKEQEPCKKKRKNKNKQLQNSRMYMTREIITQKCKNNNIPVIYADKEFPSSQLCCNCGNRHHIGANRIYICPVCGLEMDRDELAAENLKKLAYNVY